MVDRIKISDYAGVLVNQADMCKVLGVDATTVRRLVAGSVLSKDEKGYRLFDNISRYVAFVKQGKHGGIDDEARLTIQEEQLRLTKAMADERELKVKKLAGALVSADDIGEYWNRLGAEIKANMLGIPNKVSYLLAVEDEIAKINEIIKEQITQGLDTISNMNIHDIVGVLGEGEGEGEDVDVEG